MAVDWRDVVLWPWLGPAVVAVVVFLSLWGVRRAERTYDPKRGRSSRWSGLPILAAILLTYAWIFASCAGCLSRVNDDQQKAKYGPLPPLPGGSR